MEKNADCFNCLDIHTYMPLYNIHIYMYTGIHIQVYLYLPFTLQKSIYS